jgi:hypothetical protein
MNEIEVPLKITGIGAIKKELRDLKGEIANATDPQALAELTKRAGALKDQLADANEQVNIFASGSKFEQVSNGLGSIKDSIMSLDFAEAGDKAKLLTTALKGINPAEFAAQFKGFGQVILSLGSAVGVAMKQFIAFGASLLVNPIFLLVAVIVAIVAAIVLLLHKMGILKKIFDVMMIPINALIQGFKDLTDWLGLTTYAAEENAEKTAAANEKVIESANRRQEAVTGALDFEIKMAKLRGEETLDLELKRSRQVQGFSKEKLNSAKTAYNAELALGKEADKEKLKNLKKQIDEERKIILQQTRDRKYLVEQDRIDRENEAKKQAEEDKKNAEEARKRRIDANKKALEDAKKFAENRLAAARLIKDLEIASIKNENDREIVATQEKYSRLIADVQKNENYTKDEKIRLQNLYQKELEATLAKQEQIEIDAEKEKQKKLLEEYNAGLIKQYELQDKQALQLQELLAKTEDEKIQLAKDKRAIQYDAEIVAAGENQALIAALTTQYQADLNKIDKDAADARVKIKEEEEAKKRAAQLQTANDALKIAEDSTKAIQAIGDIAFGAKMAKVKKGSKEEEELAKKQFKFNKALQLSGAIVDAGKAITASLAAAPISTPIGIASLIATAATSAATIAKIASTQFTSTGGGGGNETPTLPSASSTSTTSATPSFSLFGQGNDLNNEGAPQDSQTQITVKAVVSETEITNSQNKVAKINQNATL